MDGKGLEARYKDVLFATEDDEEPTVMAEMFVWKELINTDDCVWPGNVSFEYLEIYQASMFL